MPTGTLSGEGKALWEKVYDKALKGSCNGDKECAARTAWSAVKGAGWSKNKDGNWHKKSVASEFSLYISKASYDKTTNRMNFLAVASDTDEDSYKDNMTLSLFSDFVNRIQSAELPPEQYRSEFWKGGMPYMSISHYPDMDGKAVPGVVESVYVDGNRLKAKGYFLDTPLGRACFKAVCEDLYGKEPHPDGKIRISIAFLDYSHKHRSTGYIYAKGNPDEPVCMECLREMFGKSWEGKEFLLGHLIHLALTRVPVNKRTSLEVKSMAINTRKDDALSIVGEDEEAKSLIEEVNEETLLVGKSELVIKSEEEEEPELVEESKHMKDDKKEDADEEDEMMDEKDKEKMKKEHKSEVDFAPVLSELQSLRSLVESLKAPAPVVVVHPLDEFVGALKSKYDEIVAMSATADEKLHSLQEPFNAFSQALVEQVRSSVPVEQVVVSSEKSVASVEEITNAVMQKVGAELAEIKSMLRPVSEQKQPEDVNAMVRDLVHRRSIPPKSQPEMQKTLQNKSGVVKSIQELVDRTT